MYLARMLPVERKFDQCELLMHVDRLWTERVRLTAIAYMVILSLSLSATACSSCGLSCDSPSVITIITF